MTIEVRLQMVSIQYGCQGEGLVLRHKNIIFLKRSHDYLLPLLKYYKGSDFIVSWFGRFTIWIILLFRYFIQMIKQTNKSELTYLYQSHQLAFDERLQSLRLQVESLHQNTQDLDLISELTELYGQSKNIRARRLLQMQSTKAIQTQRRQELERFQTRILEQKHSLSRKEQEIWQQSWNGKRIRYLSVHPEHFIQFHIEIMQTQMLFEALGSKWQLLQEIDSLQEQLRLSSWEEKKIDFKRIETAFIKQLLEENSKEKQIAQLYKCLASQITQQSETHRELTIKYKSLSQAKDHQILHLSKEQEGSIQISAKSISTNSEEQISGD